MRAFEFENAHEGYPVLLDAVLRTGTQQPSRVGDTLELEDVTVTFTGSEKTYPPLRSGSLPLIGDVEGVQLVSGVAADGLMLELFPHFGKYSDFWGSYAKRVSAGDQVHAAVRELSENPDTRRAVITMWDPKLDTNGGHMDHPCTIGLGFRARDGRLNMSVVMRSNDAWLGMPYDFVQFSTLHVTVAALLGLETGTYTHHAHSLHLYRRDCAAASRVLGDEDEVFELNQHSVLPVLPLCEPGWSYDDVRRECISAMAGNGGPVTEQGRAVAAGIAARRAKLKRASSVLETETAQ